MFAVNRETLLHQLLDLGVKPGGVMLVHTSFRAIRPIEGGPLVLIAALREALGSGGTLVMPSMTDDDDIPFDPLRTPCSDLGIVADNFWRLPGVLRSNSPHAFAAAGPLAGMITALHPIDQPHGLNSPVGRVYEQNGQVLLLGVGHSANTTVHLAEHMADVRYRRNKHVTVLDDGRSVRLDYKEIDHCCERFNQVDDWLDAMQLQRRGMVGHGEVRLARSRDIVDVVTAQLRTNQAVFLHDRGLCIECDDARASLS